MSEPAESRKEGWGVGRWFGLALLCYLIPFVTVWVADDVFGKDLLSSLGPEANSLFAAVYAPLIYLLFLFWGR